MNYQKIHDAIIDRAKKRILPKSVYVEKHHIIPKCEGGDIKGETVRLTLKEHRLVHKLRYKITKIFGNIAAFNWMKQPETAKRKMQISAAKHSHMVLKQKNYQYYIEKQKKSGISGGNKCKIEKLGFFSCTEEKKIEFRNRGRKTLVSKKIGMFSDEYRMKHKISLHKKIKTPDGIFNSMIETAQYYSVVPGTITYRVNSKNERWKEWIYLTEE